MQKHLKRVTMLLLAFLMVASVIPEMPAGWGGQAYASSSDIINTVAGTGPGYSGDGGAAISAKLYDPEGVAVDSDGNLYIADTANHVIRKVDPDGTISTVAGTGSGGYLLAEDGGAATSARLKYPSDVAVDSDGNLYIADYWNHRIRKVDVLSGNISTVAGNGNALYTTDGVLATTTQLNSPSGVAVDSDGNLYIADYLNHRIRKVATDGMISTVAGTGTGGYSGDGGAATSTQLNQPRGVAVDSSGNLYIAEIGNHRIRKVDPSGNISTVAGTGTAGYSGDGEAATSAMLDRPQRVAVDSSGNLYIADFGNNRIRKVDATNGKISTAAGTGTAGYSGDGEAATSAMLNKPHSVAVDSSGNLYIADYSNRRIRMVGKAYIVTFNSNGGSAVSNQQVNYNGTGKAMLPADPTRTGYKFEGWYSDSGLTMSFNFATVITGDTTLYAKWTISDFAANGQTTTTASFTWTAASGATSVKIQQSLTGANTWTDSTTAAIGASATTAQVTGLSAATGYDFKLVVVGGENAGDSNTAVNVVTNTVPLTDFAASGQTATTASFTWTAASGATSVKIQQSPTGANTWTDSTAAAIGANATTAQVTGLSAATGYDFKLVVTGGVNAGDSNTAVNVVTNTVPLTDFAASGQTTTTVTFTWTAVSGATSLKIQQSPTGVNTWTDSMTAAIAASATTAQVTGLSAGTGYDFKLVVVGGENAGDSNTIVNVVTNTVPGAPTDVTVAVGNGQATISFMAPLDDGGSAITGYTVTANPGGLTVNGTTSPITVTGLSNGTAYTLTVKAVNSAGSSAASDEVSATPQVPSPGAPVLQPAIAGNAQVSLAWNPVDGSTGYQIFKSVTSATYGAEAATVSGSVYSYDVTGLTNGTTYYFVIKAINPGGESAASNEVSAMPKTVTAAPTGVTATAGNGQVTISFTIPVDNGGSAITGYEVTASPGNITATGTASPITVTGLSNGTAYTFTVKAVNSAGSSAASTASNAVTPESPSSGDDNNSGGSTPTQPATSTPDTPTTGVEVLVNGKAENAGTATTTKENEQTVTTVVVDSKKLEDRLAAEGEHAVITIPVNTKSDVVIGELDGQMVKNMEQKQATVEIKTENATYTLPAQQINIDSISDQLGKSIQLQDIKLQIEISKPTADTVKIVESSAVQGEFTIVAPPLNFTVKAKYGDTTIDVSKFNAYVERTIAIPDGVDPNKITTGVVVDPDGTVRHVPTKIVVIDGKYYAKVNSLTNSTYSIVWHPLAFKDVEQHWAKDAVNDMGSRMVISGIGNDRFNPDQDITRAEFAAIMVRGLGLKLENGSSPFADVKTTDWYSGAIQTANAYSLISGFEDGTFRPMDKITREQAMTIIARAMKVTGLEASLGAKAADELLSPFSDASNAAEWAKNSIADSLQAGIISGRNATELAPKAYITRAEAAVIVQRLLQKSELV